MKFKRALNSLSSSATVDGNVATRAPMQAAICTLHASSKGTVNGGDAASAGAASD